MDRRQFLQQFGLISTSALVAGGTHEWLLGQPTQAKNVSSGRLIVIFLRGAVDGLNVVVPYREAAYYSSRPTIAIPQPGQDKGALKLDGRFGLHPALDALMPLWQQKSLAFIHSAGSPEPTRSHFDAQDSMESGTPGDRKTQDGWMNRLLRTLSNHNPIQAVNIGGVTPRILSGKMSVASLALDSGVARAMVLDQPKISASFDQLYSSNDALSQTYKEARLARQALLDNLKAEARMANNGAPLPSSAFGRTAQRLGHLMAKDSRIRLAFTALGGWDTHINQGGQLARNLGHLGTGLAALQKALGSAYAETSILVLSEFGRTVRENGNGGTDHGHGNVIWLLGGKVQGGKVYGDWLGLETRQLYEDRDLAITTDFRDVIATILEQHLRLTDAQLAQVLPRYQPLQTNLPLLV